MKRVAASAGTRKRQLTDKQKRESTVGEPAGTEVLNELVSLFEFEPVAQLRMSHMAWEYFNGGVADEITLRWNREAYDRLRLRPKVLVDVSKSIRASAFWVRNSRIPFY
jgi:FMN-dependent dehydrogenase